VRDLFPKGPSAHTIDQIEIMARTEVEPEGLRVGLSYALAQWGRRDLIKQKLRRLERVAASEDAETATIAQRDIAMIHYAIRDYMPAAVAYREFLRRGEATGFALMPEHYYNTACCYCLIGDQRTALQFIEQSLALNKSAAIDSSMRLKRELFEKDPEIGLARRDPEFRKLLDREFGPAKPKPKPKPKLKPKHKSKQQSAPATGGKDQNGGKPGSGGRFRGTRHQAVR
jgi:tetratricopeptide (TPR) repeat protein